MDERRIEPRAPIELRVEYNRLNSFFSDYTRNISKGGTFIRTEKPLPLGTEFRFVLTVPTLEKPLELTGRVQWIVRQGEDAPEGPGMGIGFVYHTEAERVKVERVVEELMIASLGELLYRKLLGRDL